MAWTNNPYCTLADVKLAMDPNMGSQDDTYISSLIVRSQADLDSEIGYIFQQDGTVQSPATRIYDGNGQLYLWTDDIVSLTSVVETIKFTYLGSGAIWQAGTTTSQDITADIILKPNNYAAKGQPAHKLVRNSGLHFSEGIQNYTVTGVFGWPITSDQTYAGIPNDISWACIRLTIHKFKMRDTAYSDMVQAPGGIREKYSKNWPEDVKEIIANYQRTRFFTHGGEY